MKQPVLSVIIVSYNTSDLLDACLKTLTETKTDKFTLEVIVVDNDSSDGSMDMVRNKYPSVIRIKNNSNLGFARANNVGIRKSTGTYILLLNSDTEVPRDTLGSMVELMNKKPEVGAATCKLLLGDGTIDPACHRGFPTPWVAFTYMTKLEHLFPKTKIFGGYHQGYKDFTKVHDVDCISGAFFFLRREVIDDIGLLDEDYFMYGEDIDWCYRIKKSNWRILYNPDVYILHKKKQSGRSSRHVQRRISTEIHFHTNNWLFYKKNYAKKYGLLISSIVHIFYSARIYLLRHFSI